MVKWKSKEKDTVAKPVLTLVAPVEEESFLQIHKQYVRGKWSNFLDKVTFVWKVINCADQYFISIATFW